MKYLKVLIISLIIMIGFIKNTYALEIVKTDDIHSTIPINYHFAPRFIENKTSITLCDAPKGMKWNIVDGYYQLQNKSNQAVMPDNQYKGKISIIYHQVGYFNEQAVDMKITITNWNSQCKRIEFGKKYIGFGNASGSSGGFDSYISAKIEYFYAGSQQLFTQLKGHQPVGDLDYFNNSNQSEWIKLNKNCSTSIIIPQNYYNGFDLSRINNNMIGALKGNGGTSNTDGLDFVYLFHSPTHTIDWYGGFLRLNMTCPDKEFQVNYYGGIGEGNMPSHIVNYGVSTKLKANTFSKDGYHFNGWHVYRDYDDRWACIKGNYWQSGVDECEDYLHYKDEQIVSKSAPCGNVYMYACFKENDYTIQFDANGGTGQMNNQSFLYDHQQALNKNNFIKEGYKFAGWSLKKDGHVNFKDQEVIKNLTVTNNAVITLYAKWEKIYYTNTIHHIFYIDENQTINGGQSQLSCYYDEQFYLNEYLLTIPNGYKANDEFYSASIDQAWFSYDMNKAICQQADNMSFYIFYSPIEYSITYDLNGGTNHKDNPSSYQVLNQINLLSPEKSGCKFKGWYNNDQFITGINTSKSIDYSSYEKFLNSLSDCISGNLHLKAHWESIPLIRTKTNYYYINEDISIKDVLKNASAFDEIDGDLSSLITIKEITYPSYKDTNPNKLDTSSLGVVYITYTVTNSSSITSTKVGAIYIIDNYQNVSYDNLFIYPRYIDDDLCSDGLNPIDTLSNDSIWLYEDYYNLLINSLTKKGEDYLHEYDYINEGK